MADTWFKCEPTQFLLGMNRLDTPEQALVYVVVCFRIYEAGGPVPNDPLTFAASAKMGVRKIRKAIDELVEMGKLFLIGDDLMNPRAASELAARAALSEVRSKAGKDGGRPRKNAANSRSTDGERAVNAQKSDENRAFTAGSSSVGEEEMAENSHSEKPNAFYARGREEEIREESPPPPNKSVAQRLREEWGLDDLDQPLSEADRTAAVERVASLSDQSEGEGQEVDIRDLTSWIMVEANMAVPPIDISLVAGWVRMGVDVDRHIKPIVARLAANARGGVRSMRYFDKTIRDVFDQEKRADQANIAHFRSIGARSTRN